MSLIEKGDEVCAALQYYLKKTKTLNLKQFKLITMPVLTQTMGPWFRTTGAKYSNKLSEQKDAVYKMLGQIPSFDFFSQNFNYEITNWLPFYWKGFSSTVRYTYVIDLNDSLDVLWSNFNSSMKNKVKKAKKNVSLVLDKPVDVFYEVNKKTFHRQGINIPYTLEFVKQMDNALLSKNKRKIFYAVDENGNIHSALYLIWGDRSSYVHMVGEDPELRNSGAGILLIWEAIKYSKNILNLDSFDFEGSMIEGVEQVRRSCGGVQMPYFQVWKTNSRLLKLRSALKTICQ